MKYELVGVITQIKTVEGKSFCDECDSLSVDVGRNTAEREASGT